MAGLMVLVLGGGVGGLVTANRLRRGLPREHRIVVFDRSAQHVFAPSLLWLMTGTRKAHQITRPLAGITRRGIEFVHGPIERIEPTRRVVTIGGREYQGDFMVVALGAELAPEVIPGLPQAGHNFYTLEGAESLRGALDAFQGGKLVLLTAAMGYKCPAAPYEAAMLIASYLRRHGRAGKTDIDIYASEPAPMATAGPEASAGVRQMVEAQGIGYHPTHVLKEVNPGQRRLTFSNGVEATYDLLAYVPPHRAPTVVREAGLCGEGGWVEVDRQTLQTKHERVYALGDVVAIPLANGKSLPRAGVFAHGQAEVVAVNILALVKGAAPSARFEGRGECFIEVGNGKAGFGGGNFYAEPDPMVKMRRPGRRWHLAKVLFEKDWLRRWL